MERSWRRPEAIDTRVVFRAYAALMLIAGLVTASWGQIWLGSSDGNGPWARAALVRVFGSIMIGAGCSAIGCARVEDPGSRRRCLGWFALGHGAVLLMMAAQTAAIWDSGASETATFCLYAITIALAYLWFTAEGEFTVKTLTSLFGEPSGGTTEQLRSRYEQQIRQAAGQEERNRLARDLHDSIKQQIFVVQTAAATAQERFDSDRPGARQAIDQVRSAAREAIAEMQAMLDQLRAEPLGAEGLIEALRKQCEALGFRTGAHVDFRIGDLPPAEALVPGAHQALFRFAQEALANVARHARAQNVVVTLGTAYNRLRLAVRDEGAGFDPEHTARGMGTGNMRARAREFNGEFSLTSAPGAGTTVEFAIPYVLPESSRTYRNRALVSAGATLTAVVLLIVIHREGGLTWAAVIGAVSAARYFVAWRRVRRHEVGA